MAITLNARGTSVPFFTIGKQGTTLYQGAVDPSLIYTLKNGDLWIDTTSSTIEIWSSATSSWKAPVFGGMTFSSNTITAATSQDLTLKITDGNNIVFDAGPGNPVLTTPIGQDLHIHDSLGGALYLNDIKWPAADGSSNQVLTTDGSGNLSFTTINKVGSPAPATTATTGFAYLPVMSGTPTGTPTAETGYAPMVVDSSGSKLWIYVGGAWKSATLS